MNAIIFKLLAFCFFIPFSISGAISKTHISIQKNILLPGSIEDSLIIEKYEVLKTDSTVKHGKYTYYYNGKKRIQGRYDTNRRIGIWIWYDLSNGEVDFMGRYSNGKKDGKWIYYKGGDKKHCEIHYKDGNLHGMSKSFFPNGNPYYQKNFENGRLSGKEVLYFKNGKKRYERTYKNDTILSEEVYFKNGNPYRKLEYKKGKLWNILIKGQHDGPKSDFGNLKDGNGVLKSHYIPSPGRYVEDEMPQKTYAVYKNGERNGLFKQITRRRARLIMEGQCKQGVKKGKWVYSFKKWSYPVRKRPYSVRKGMIREVDYSKEDSVLCYEEDFIHLSVGDSLFNYPSTFPSKEKSENADQVSLLNFINVMMEYPEKAKKEDIQGLVLLQIIISKEGEVTVSEVLKSRNDQLTKEAIRIAKSMPPWSPALDKGLPYNQRLNLPIYFDLD